MHYIKERSIDFSVHKFCTLLFQMCIIADAIIGFDPRYYVISKGLMLVFFLATIIRIVFERDIYLGTTFYLSIPFMIITGLSCLWADYPGVSMERFKTQIQLYILFLFTYLLLTDEEVDIKAYLDALYLTGIGMGMLALYRYGVYGLIEGLKAGQRMGGAITNENIFGIVFSKAALVSYYYYIKSKGKRIHYTHAFFMGIFIFFAFSSGSKKAFLMIFVGVLGINVLENGIKKMWKVLLASAVVIICLFLILRLPIFATMSKRIQGYFSGEKDSSELVRLNMINMSMELFRQNPILGHGFANFGIITGFGTYSHNNMTEILVSTGIIGLILFYIPYIPILRYGWNKGVMGKNYIYTLVFIIAVIYLVFGYAMVEYYDKEYWVLFGVLVAFVDNEKTIDERKFINAQLHKIS